MATARALITEIYQYGLMINMKLFSIIAKNDVSLGDFCDSFTLYLEYFVDLSNCSMLISYAEMQLSDLETQICLRNAQIDCADRRTTFRNIMKTRDFIVLNLRGFGWVLREEGMTIRVLCTEEIGKISKYNEIFTVIDDTDLLVNTDLMDFIFV